jgi:hypothetical protein
MLALDVEAQVSLKNILIATDLSSTSEVGTRLWYCNRQSYDSRIDLFMKAFTGWMTKHNFQGSAIAVTESPDADRCTRHRTHGEADKSALTCAQKRRADGLSRNPFTE